MKIQMLSCFLVLFFIFGLLVETFIDLRQQIILDEVLFLLLLAGLVYAGHSSSLSEDELNAIATSETAEAPYGIAGIGIPQLVMLTMGREHNLFSEAYSDYTDIDGDGQHNPDEIPVLMAPIIDGRADLVNGSRYLNGFDENTPAYRRVGQRVLDIATNVTSGTSVTDSQSGFRAFKGKTINHYRFRDTGFGIESEMLADAAEHNLKILEVPITVRYDVENSSTKGPVTHGVGVLMKIVIDKLVRTFKR